LATLDLPLAAKQAVAVLSTEKPETVQDLFEAFTSRKGGAALLAQALAGQKLPADIARVGVRTLRGSGRPDDGLLDALTQAGGLTPSSRKPDAKELEALTAEVRSHGDAVRGEAIYRRAELQCQKCHAIGGAGGAVGPDMSSIGASAPIDYLVESLLLPSKAIKEGYHSVLVTTKRGEQFTGIKIRETKEAITLRTDQDKEVVIPLRRVENLQPSKVSLMPEGLTDSLTRNELVDLVAFLSALGKTERFSVGRDRPARRWQVLVPTKEVFHLLGRKGVVGLLDDPSLTWEPTYSTVAGYLPLEGLPTFKTFGKEGATLTLLRAELETTAEVKAVLKLADETGLTLWLDGEPLTPARAMNVTLQPGTHVVQVLLDRAARKAPLRLEIDDTPGTAALRFVGGK